MNDFLPLAPLIGLYAETHYRFRFFPFSLYYRREPEIVFDAPHRIEPNAELPVTLLIKDAYKFPIELLEVAITISDRSGITFTQRFPINRPLDCHFYHQIFDIDVSRLQPGELRVTPSLEFKIRGNHKKVSVDNFVGLSHAPLKIRRAADPLPLFPGWIAGELHCHTSYGPDQVEFSAPLEVIKRNSAAMGLHFSALTDHSYDLDDLPDNYLKQDPELIKWQLLQEESARLNKAGGPILLPGEELSCRNSKGRNVHMLILGNREFLHGSGDGAEKWFRTRSEYSIAEALQKVSPSTFVAAAHPLVPTPPLEWLLVGRGEWTTEDLMHERLDGWQIANGDWGLDYQRGFSLWEKFKNSKKRIRLYGGNDAHGNFNRFRQVSLPMVRLRENDRNLFGRVTTRLKSNARNTEELLVALKTALCQISDGPSIDLNYNPSNEIASISWNSTEEFGFGEEIRIYFEGKSGQKSVEIIPLSGSLFTGEISKKIGGGLLTAIELIVKTGDGERHRALMGCPDPI